MNTIYHIGIDLHAQKAAIAWASSNGELEYHGSCSATIKTVERTLRRLAKSFGVALTDLRVAYEAGPTGFVLALRIQIQQGPAATLLRTRISSCFSAERQRHGATPELRRRSVPD